MRRQGDRPRGVVGRAQLLHRQQPGVRRAQCDDSRPTSPWMGGDEEALAIASQQAGDSLTPAQASRFYRRRGLDYFVDEPGRPRRSSSRKKLYMFWEGPERSNEKYIYFFWDQFGLGRVPMPGFWLVVALGTRRDDSPVAAPARVRTPVSVRARVHGRRGGVLRGRSLSFARRSGTDRLRGVDAVELASAMRARRWNDGGAHARRSSPHGFAVVNASYPDFLRRRPAHIAISHYTLAGAYSRARRQRRRHGRAIRGARAPSSVRPRATTPASPKTSTTSWDAALSSAAAARKRSRRSGRFSPMIHARTKRASCSPSVARRRVGSRKRARPTR